MSAVAVEVEGVAVAVEVEGVELRPVAVEVGGGGARTSSSGGGRGWG